jgi:hypothetical protein
MVIGKLLGVSLQVGTCSLGFHCSPSSRCSFNHPLHGLNNLVTLFASGAFVASAVLGLL